MSERILIVLGHPLTQSFCGALAKAYAQGATRGGAKVEILNLGELDFNPVLMGYGAQEDEPDLAHARELVLWAQHIVWVFPIWWGNMPALLKGFIDRLFLPRWAFLYEDGETLPKGLLSGRTSTLITTMDSPTWWYKLWHRQAAHRAMARATLSFVGIKVLSGLSLSVVRSRDERWRAKALERAHKGGLKAAAMKPRS